MGIKIIECKKTEIHIEETHQNCNRGKLRTAIVYFTENEFSHCTYNFSDNTNGSYNIGDWEFLKIVATTITHKVDR